MDTPTPPDPYATAAAQTRTNQATATTQQELNMVNQRGPNGSLTYSQSGTNPDGTPQFTATTALSDAGQGLLNSQNTAKQHGVDLANELLGSGSGALSGKPLDLGWSSTEANLDALGAKTIDPKFAQQETAMNADLANRGIAPGTEQWNIAQNQFNQNKSQAYDNLYLQGHQTATNDLTNEYNSPLSTMSTLLTGSQPAAPTFTSTPQTGVQGTNVAGLVEQNYGQQVAQNNAMMGGMFGLAGTIGGAALGGPAGAAVGRGIGQAGYNALGGVTGYAT